MMHKKYFCEIENYSREITVKMNIDLYIYRWENHGRPPGGDVSAIADTGNIRPGVLFTVRYIKYHQHSVLMNSCIIYIT